MAPGRNPVCHLVLCGCKLEIGFIFLNDWGKKESRQLIFYDIGRVYEIQISVLCWNTSCHLFMSLSVVAFALQELRGVVETAILSPQSKQSLLSGLLQRNYAGSYLRWLVPWLSSFYRWRNGSWEFYVWPEPFVQGENLGLGMLAITVPVRASPEQPRQLENSKNKYSWGSGLALQSPLRILKCDFTQWVCLCVIKAWERAVTGGGWIK